MDNVLFLDIETIPTTRPDVREYIAASVEHPGNISKPETIAAWNAEKRPAAVEDAVSRTSLDGAFGQVCVVGVAGWHDEPTALFDLNWNSGGEAALLVDLNAELNRRIAKSDLFTTTIVGHNVSAFDLRFLLQRYIVNGIKPHIAIHRAAQAKPWESDKVYDTMIQFAGVGNRISLDKLCLALGLPGKGDMDGSKVWPMVRDGMILKVVDYCKDDVRKTRAAYRRMTFTELADAA